MLPWKPSRADGSAVLEFVAFILVGQLLVFGGSMAISQHLTQKVELQNLAAVKARSIAKKIDFELPVDVTLHIQNCPERFVCISLAREGMNVSAVSLRW